ncbi:MAG: prepilin-type N-terminal cleavage/methylation domain-containing protein [Verrucomicrobiota bacterium]
MKRQRAFTLVEVAFSLAIVATGLIAIIALIPQGQEAAKASSEHTVTAIILEDVHNRLEGEELTVGDLPTSPFYYDAQGVFIPDGEDPEEINRRIFRADIRIEDIADKSGLPDTNGLMAGVIELSWPVVPATGDPLGKGNPKTTITYYLTTLTGLEWTEVDSSYKPKIEY